MCVTDTIGALELIRAVQLRCGDVSENVRLPLLLTRNRRIADLTPRGGEDVYRRFQLWRRKAVGQSHEPFEGSVDAKAGSRREDHPALLCLRNQ